MTKIPTMCTEPTYGHHVTNGLGPNATCQWCGKPMSEWSEEEPAPEGKEQPAE